MALISLLMLAALFATAFAIGQRMLFVLGHRFSPSNSDLSELFWAVGIGIGIIGLGLICLGALGLYSQGYMFAWLILASLIARSRHDIVESPFQTNGAQRSLRSQLRAILHDFLGNPLQAAVIAVALLIGLINALSPPTGFDALTYHLYVPKMYLETGHIRLLDSPVQSNYPILMQMVYGYGLVFGSGIFAKLLNFSFFAALLLWVHHEIGRSVDPRASMLGLLLPLSAPICLFWAGTAYVDGAWDFFELGALLALIRWSQTARRHWLVIAALMAGFALGIKFQGLLGLLAFLGLIAWLERRKGLKAILRASVVFGSIAAVFLLPVFLKNYFLSGNPIYPYIFGGPGWSLAEVDFLGQLVTSPGRGFVLRTYFLIPFDIFLNNGLYSTFDSFEFPSIFFLLVLLYPLVKNNSFSKNIAVFVLLRYLTWTAAQHTRYLLPLYAPLSILVAYQVAQWLARLPRLWKPVIGIISAVALLALTIPAAYLVIDKPWRPLLNQETVQAYLERNLTLYPSMNFVLTELPENSRLKMYYDSRAYYCDPRCVPDRAQIDWPIVYSQYGEIEAIAGDLRDEGITHLYIGRTEAEFFTRTDSDDIYSTSLRFLEQDFLPACGNLIYEDSDVAIFELVCPVK